MFRFFERLVDPYTPYPETDAPPRKLWPFMVDLTRPFRGVFAATFLFAVFVAAFEVAQIWYLGRLVDLLTSTPRAEIWPTYGTEFLIVAAAILVLRPVIYGIHMLLINNTMGPNLGTLTRWRTHRQVLRQSIGWFENDFAGRIANRISQTPTAVMEAVFQVFDAAAFAMAYVVGAAILLSGADVRLLVPLAGWFVAYLVLMRWVVIEVARRAKAASDARSRFTGRVVDSYTNIHSVKMFAHHDREVAYAKEAIDDTRETLNHEMRVYSVMDLGLTLLNGLMVVGVIGLALWLFLAGNATAGIIAAASALTLRLSAMSGWIMWAMTTLFRNVGVIQEGMETITDPIRLTDRPDARELELTEGRISFRGVSHHYGKEAGGLEHVDLEIAPGEKVGLIGPSGAGKSTLVKLLLRFYDLETGEIRIDGQEIREVTQDSLRRAIGMVQQDSALLHRSVRDNILYGKPDATEAEMTAAAEAAEAAAFIPDLEDGDGRRGYDAHVGERGVKLSGGQRQRIALARVILKDAPILVLDEATSALDSEVEAAIQKTLYRMMEGKTVIAIAHRLSTIARMDRIVVMDQGRVVEDGTHESLLKKGGLYARLWQRQSGGFIGREAAE